MRSTLAPRASQRVRGSCLQGHLHCCRCMTLALGLLFQRHKASPCLPPCMCLGRSHRPIIQARCRWAARQPLAGPLSLTRAFETACLMTCRCGGALMTGHPPHLLQHCIIPPISTCTLHPSILETSPRTCRRQRLCSRPRQATLRHHLMPLATPAQRIPALACSSSHTPSTQSSSSHRSRCSPPASRQTGLTMRPLVSDGHP